MGIFAANVLVFAARPAARSSKRAGLFLSMQRQLSTLKVLQLYHSTKTRIKTRIVGYHSVINWIYKKNFNLHRGKYLDGV